MVVMLEFPAEPRFPLVIAVVNSAKSASVSSDSGFPAWISTRAATSEAIPVGPAPSSPAPQRGPGNG